MDQYHTIPCTFYSGKWALQPWPQMGPLLLGRGPKSVLFGRGLAWPSLNVALVEVCSAVAPTGAPFAMAGASSVQARSSLVAACVGACLAVAQLGPAVLGRGPGMGLFGCGPCSETGPRSRPLRRCAC